jgi:hypothetical protein
LPPRRFQGRANALDESREGGDIADIELQRNSLAPEAFDLGHDGFRGAGTASVGEERWQMPRLMPGMKATRIVVSR